MSATHDATTHAPQPLTRPVWTLSRLLTAVGNETLKGLRHGWGERLQILIELPLFIVFLLLVSFTAGTADTIVATGDVDWTLDPRQTTWMLIGFVAFAYAYLHVQKMFWRLLAEIQSGTLEQTYLSPLPSWVHVVAGRIAAAVAETAFVVAATAVAISLFTRIELRWHAAALVSLALLIVGAAGMALIIAGVTLVWKRTMILNDLVLMLVLFLGGVFLPVDGLPSWAEPVAWPLFLTHATAALRAGLLDGAPLPAGGIGSLPWMLTTAVAWFAAGLLAFRLFERIARRQGSLSHF